MGHLYSEPAKITSSHRAAAKCEVTGLLSGTQILKEERTVLFGKEDDTLQFLLGFSFWI